MFQSSRVGIFLPGLRRVSEPLLALCLGLAAGVAALARIPQDAGEARRMLLAQFRIPESEIVEIAGGELKGHAKGGDQAPLVMIEFSDFACHHCQTFNLAVYPFIEKHFIEEGRVQYFSLNFYFQTPSHARAVMAAGRQGKYWEMKAGLFEHIGVLNENVHLSIARAISLNLPEFLEDSSSSAVAREVDEERGLGEKIGVKTTPTFVLGWRLPGNAVVGFRIAGPVRPWSYYRRIMEEMLGQE